MKLHELREARARAVAEMRSLTDTAEVETRDLTDVEDARFKTLRDEISALDRKIERAQALADAERAAPAILINGRGDGSYETRARDFSVTRAIRAAIGDTTVDAGLERELSQEVARRSGRAFQGIPVPDEIFLEQRTHTTGGSAADLVPNVHRADLFIDRLRSAMVVERLGATVLSGLVGSIDIPRQVGSSSAQWIAEESALTETDASFDDVTLAPKTVGAMTSYSRRTLINASPNIESIVRNDLAAVIARAVDYQAMLGNGSGNTPVGIVNQNGVAEVSMATPTWSKVLDFVASIEGADAAIGGLGWALNPFAVKKLRSTNKAASEPEHGFIMTDAGSLAGYTAAATTALPGAPSDGSPPVAHPATAIFGAWSQLLVGRWSGIDVLINPYETQAYSRGRVLIRAMQDLDVQVRHPESFAFCDDLPVA